ncbi:MAG TPA: Flp family type IVb pilin [Blastocatellia bacterium]|nr:Flp family type IVb pilin [Blastocatellia bacterium]
MSRVKTFCQDEEGLELTEYAVAAALITLACVVAINTIGSSIASAINSLIARINP